MKTILSDAESCEEHDKTKYSPHRTSDGGVMDLFVLRCSRDHGKGIKNKAFWTIVKKVIFFAWLC